MNKKIQFLDCTLRDGGYYNNWSFSTSLINDYIYAVAKAKVNIIEIGFRFLENENFKGQCAYADDAFINSLDIFFKARCCIKGLGLNSLLPSNRK